ncbi:MAG: sodium-dependent transporter [Verrucomicrobiaceae bacterium]|nr:sodium-dependent transporter [Verrucomicrobiaceae bacterium]
MPLSRQSIHGGWRSQWTFIAAVTGASIGLGNLWKFAYLAGANGGASFILMYLLCIALVATPVLVAEVVIGARGRSDPVHSLESIVLESALSRHWRWLGWLSCITALLILSYLSVVGGWLITYCRWVFQGDLSAASARQVGELFGQLLADGPHQAMTHGIFLLAVWLVVALGVIRGLGLVFSILAPALLVLLLVMVLTALRMGDMAAAVQFMFRVNLEDIHADGALAALGQAFFSLAIGTGAMMTFGAYAPARRSLVKMLGTVVALHVVVALLAGLAIFPLVFAHRVQPSFGPGLMFVTLPYIFGNLPYGSVIGTVFFAMVLIAAFGSAVALLEPTTAWLVQRLGWSRPRAALVLAGVVWLLGLLSIGSFSMWPEWRPGGKSLFAWIDWIAADVMLPLCALAISVFVGWRMRREAIRDELLTERPRLFWLWQFSLRYIAPPAITLILLAGLYRVLIQPS